MNNNLKIEYIEVHRAPWLHRYFELAILYTDKDGEKIIAKYQSQDGVKELNEGVVMPRDGIFEIDEKCAQGLANTLWDCGIRPNQSKGSAGQLEATNKHLQDMRKIAFKKLGINNE